MNDTYSSTRKMNLVLRFFVWKEVAKFTILEKLPIHKFLPPLLIIIMPMKIILR